MIFVLFSPTRTHHSVDVYSFLQTPLQNPSTNVASILRNRNSSNETLLSQADTAKVLCTLSHQAENLFADAADRLCLPALLQFIKVQIVINSFLHKF